MSQLTVQQSYILCWELLPDRNRISMGLWYWELMSHHDPVVLPVGTLHSLEWFRASRIFIYSHHNTFLFFSKTSVHHQVCPRDNPSTRLNLTSKSNFTPFWACPRDDPSPVQARTTKFGPEVENTLAKFPLLFWWLVELTRSSLT